MKYDDLLHLKNIVDAIDAIDVHKRSGAPTATLQQAVLFEIIKVGEAASQLTEALKQKHKELPWRLIVDTRNRFVHGYYDIDYSIMWDIVDQHLPDVKNKIQHIIKSLEN